MREVKKKKIESVLKEEKFSEGRGKGKGETYDRNHNTHNTRRYAVLPSAAGAINVDQPFSYYVRSHVPTYQATANLGAFRKGKFNENWNGG